MLAAPLRPAPHKLPCSDKPGYAGLPGKWGPVKWRRGPERALGALSTVLL